MIFRKSAVWVRITPLLAVKSIGVPGIAKLESAVVSNVTPGSTEPTADAKSPVPNTIRKSATLTEVVLLRSVPLLRVTPSSFRVAEPLMDGNAHDLTGIRAIAATRPPASGVANFNLRIELLR